MAVEIITKEDLNEFRFLLINDFKELLQDKQAAPKKWLKSSEVRRLLNISPGTLQTLRINRILDHTHVGGTIYYLSADIDKVLEQNKVKSDRNLFNSVK